MTKTTIANWLNLNTKQLIDSGIESARLDCLLLLEDELNKSRESILAHSEAEISPSYLLALNTKLTQRLNRIPLAYIRNTQEFYGRNFIVNEAVLIPRPESEAIIELLLSTGQQVPSTIVDIGTGSGCLAISAKLEFPESKVIATDISEVALVIARKNAKLLNADIDFFKADLMPSTTYQLPITVLANLPYVPTDLITSPEITKEPQIALFSGEYGMNHYKRFWEQLAVSGIKPSTVITESLGQQHNSQAKMAEESGYALQKTLGLAQIFVAQTN